MSFIEKLKNSAKNSKYTLYSYSLNVNFFYTGTHTHTNFSCLLLISLPNISIQVHMKGREVGGGFRMGNTCTPMADSCQCMAKTTTILWLAPIKIN